MEKGKKTKIPRIKRVYLVEFIKKEPIIDIFSAHIYYKLKGEML